MGDSHADELVAGDLCDVGSFVHDMSGTGAQKTRHGVQCCCLSGTVGTDQSDDLSLIYIEGDSF